MTSKPQRRWRLALGRYARDNLEILEKSDQEIDRALDFLYSREYEKRGVKTGRGPGSLDPTQMNAINWLGKARSLFPETVFETLQDHALDRYGLSDLLNDPQTLESLAPNQNLLKVLLGFQGRAQPAVKEKLREIADQVIREIVERLRSEIQRAFSGRKNRFRRSNIASAANFDWRTTIRANLKNYDPIRERIIADRIFFNARERRHLPWRIILCVDQSGSMTNSIIYSAVMAAILSGLPGVTVSMVLFDTSVVDVSDRLTDPLETLLSVQLGGGTNIGKAVAYCENLVEDADRTVLTLISDFGEGAYPRPLYASIARLAEQRVKLIGLAALDDGGEPVYDQMIAGRLADLGMHVGAMTPDRFAQWLAGVMQ
ncbi:MAG: VWA domain-containing protein [Candidatus Thiodiazotropha sp. 6PLUC2]